MTYKLYYKERVWFLLELVKFEGYDHIYGPDNFLEEFCKQVLDVPSTRVIANPKSLSSSSKQYVQWLQRSLTQLDTMGTATTRLKGFEKLPGTDNIYSARYPNTGKNPRILYFYIDGQDVVLLCPFLEKNSGAYQRAIKLAESRKSTFQNQWPIK